MTAFKTGVLSDTGSHFCSFCYNLHFTGLHWGLLHSLLTLLERLPLTSAGFSISCRGHKSGLFPKLLILLDCYTEVDRFNSNTRTNASIIPKVISLPSILYFESKSFPISIQLWMIFSGQRGDNAVLSDLFHFDLSLFFLNFRT